MHFCFCYPTWPEHRLVICCVNKQVHPECYFPCSVTDAPMQTVGRSKWIFRNYFFLSWSVDYILILYQHYSSLHNSILLKITESWSSGQGVGCNSGSSVLSNISSQICPVIGRKKKTPSLPWQPLECVVWLSREHGALRQRSGNMGRGWKYKRYKHRTSLLIRL